MGWEIARSPWGLRDSWSLLPSSAQHQCGEGRVRSHSASVLLSFAQGKASQGLALWLSWKARGVLGNLEFHAWHFC